MRTTPHTKALWIVLFAVPVGCFLFFFGSVRLHSALLVGSFLWAYFCFRLVLSLRCSRCRERIAAGPDEVGWGKGALGHSCPHCGLKW
jgi:hypothetical protein